MYKNILDNLCIIYFNLGFYLILDNEKRFLLIIVIFRCLFNLNYINFIYAKKDVCDFKIKFQRISTIFG